MLAMSTPAMAQDVDYAVALKPIVAAIEAAPNDPKAAKDLIKEYQKTFKKSEEAIVALGKVYLCSITMMQRQRLQTMLSIIRNLRAA